MSFRLKYDGNGELIKDGTFEQLQSLAEQQVPISAPISTPVSEPIQQFEEQQEYEDIQEEPVQEQIEQVEQNKTKVAREDNWERLRREKWLAERERDEAIQFAEQLKNQYKQPKQQVEIEEEDDDIQIGQDDLAEGKHLKSLNKKYKDLKKELNSYKQITAQQQQEQQLALTEARLKSKFPDFDSIVSSENLDKFRVQHPEIFNTISSSQDIYSKAVSAYTMIKNLGINKDDSYLSEKAKAQINSAKPKPMNSIAPQRGSSPLSQANAFENGLTEPLRKKLLQEMRDAAKNI